MKKIRSKINSSDYKIDYAIFFSRYLVPFFFHNIFFGVFSDKFLKFMFIITLAEIPYVYSVSLIGRSLNQNIISSQFSLITLINDKSFIIPLFLVIIFLLISKIKLK